MTRPNLIAFALLLAILLITPAAAHAALSYDNCTGTISSLPAVIATPGTWCLKTDLSTAITSGKAITINGNDVTIDCNGFKLGGLAAGAATFTEGISANGPSNATVRHCNIRGFHTGVTLTGHGHLVEDNRLDGNTEFGIYVQGDDSIVRRNRVFNTGGSTISGAWAFAIDSKYSIDVLDNTISGVSVVSGGNGNAFGIYTYLNASGRVIGNGVRGLSKDGTGHIRGIYNQNSDRITMRDNDLVGDGSANSAGVDCVNANGRAENNTISGFVTAISTCNDSGGNAVIP